MAKHAPGRVRAFSLSFDHPLYDEGALAREMADKAGAERRDNKLCPALNMPMEPGDLLSSLLDRLDVVGQMTGRHVVNQSQYAVQKTGLVNYILVNLGDRVEMAHSVEGRLPFLDHWLVEFARTLPVDLKIRGTVEKYILRQALQPVLTETV